MATDRATLELHLHLHDHVLSAANPALDARVDADTSEELVERVSALPRRAPVRVRVHVTAHGPVPQGIADVIRRHYALLRERAEFRRRRTVRAGRFSLFVGVVVLLMALISAQALSGIATGGFARIVEEGLTIVGWVALWRPLDLLLFDRWALNREIALYRKLEQAEIEVV